MAEKKPAFPDKTVFVVVKLYEGLVDEVEAFGNFDMAMNHLSRCQGPEFVCSQIWATHPYDLQLHSELIDEVKG
jgi:hypothetical protein